MVKLQHIPIKNKQIVSFVILFSIPEFNLNRYQQIAQSTPNSIGFIKHKKSPKISDFEGFSYFVWSWRESNLSVIRLNISYLIFQNLSNSRITTSKTYSFEYQVASICFVKIVFYHFEFQLQ